MLTPASDDENRKAEADRQKKAPTSFGTDAIDTLPKDWNPNGGLKVIADDDSAKPKKAKKAD